MSALVTWLAGHASSSQALESTSAEEYLFGAIAHVESRIDGTINRLAAQKAEVTGELLEEIERLRAAEGLAAARQPRAMNDDQYTVDHEQQEHLASLEAALADATTAVVEVDAAGSLMGSPSGTALAHQRSKQYRESPKRVAARHIVEEAAERAAARDELLFQVERAYAAKGLASSRHTHEQVDKAASETNIGADFGDDEEQRQHLAALEAALADATTAVVEADAAGSLMGSPSGTALGHLQRSEQYRESPKRVAARRTLRHKTAMVEATVAGNSTLRDAARPPADVASRFLSSTPAADAVVNSARTSSLDSARSVRHAARSTATGSASQGSTPRGTSGTPRGSTPRARSAPPSRMRHGSSRAATPSTAAAAVPNLGLARATSATRTSPTGSASVPPPSRRAALGIHGRRGQSTWLDGGCVLCGDPVVKVLCHRSHACQARYCCKAHQRIGWYEGGHVESCGLPLPTLSSVKRETPARYALP